MKDIAGKGENAGDQLFHLFQQCFQKFTFLGLLKVGFVWLRIKSLLSHDKKRMRLFGQELEIETGVQTMWPCVQWLYNVTQSSYLYHGQ